MQVNEKIKFIRHIKQWSQEEIAHRLGISPSTYGSIERGKTKLSLKRLAEIAKVLEIDLAQLLFDTNGNNIVNFGSIHGNHCHNWCDSLQSEQILELQHELEKARLEIDYLKQQNTDLREMMKLLQSEANVR